MEIKWERNDVETLIVSIQEHPCLYNIKSKEYMDRNKKAMAFHNVHQQFEQQMPGLTVEDIKKKWKNLRSQYIREIRLMQNSKKSGSGRTEVYAPKLWCFEQLSFLETHSATRQSTDNTVVDENFPPIISEASEEQISKRPKQNSKFAEIRRQLISFKDVLKEKPKQTNTKYSWLGSMVTARMEDIPPEKQEEAAWTIQNVLHEFIGSACSAGIASGSSTETARKDPLQLSMEGLFDESDLDEMW